MVVCELALLSEVIVMFGCGLRELMLLRGTDWRAAIDRDILLEVSQHCPCIERLCLHASATMATAKQLVKKCTHLQDLRINVPCNVLASALGPLFRAARSDVLRRVTLGQTYDDGSVFCSLITQFPWIEFLEANSLSYQRSTGFLSISPQVRNEHLASILHACPVTKLWAYSELDEDSVCRLADALMESNVTEELEELELVNRDFISGFNPQLLTYIPTVSSLLKRLYLHVMVAVTDKWFAEMATTCPLLEVLYLGGMNTFTLSDIGMIALFNSCHCLKDVRFAAAQLTFKSLQAILDNRLLLEMFGWSTCSGLDDNDVKRFNQLAKERKMLPVPTVAKMDLPSSLFTGSTVSMF